MPNRLASSTSPYLLQHQNNPVDWYPWGDEAFAKALDEDLPVFLSIGYSSCHWCHVMEHESFEDPEVAEVLNKGFVAIKVDREERPDIDEAYMTAVQMTSGRGGWPMSVFLTPDRKPFFAGTYFPKDDRGQHPGFKTVLRQVEAAWRTRRSDLQKAGDQLAKAIGETMTARAPGTFAKLDTAFVNECLQAILSDFDGENGGFGTAPKFPPHAALELLVLSALQPQLAEEMREASLSVVAFTLQKMVLGGIHDHVGGGFHRYSTDEKWLLPHFEKMLYDNALILANLARGAGIIYPLDQNVAEFYLAAAQGIVDWVSREMTSPEGLFYSALDADSEGEEGKFYVWTLDEIREVLGDDADAFIEAYNLLPEGNFKDEATQQLTGANIPFLTADYGARFDEALARLRMAREKRIKPGLDDKALVAWNGMMIGALAEAGMGEMAERAALAILTHERELGELPHQIAKGQATGPAFLDDYASLVDGLLKLVAVKQMFEERGESFGLPSSQWVAEADRLKNEMVKRFWDDANGGFFSTSDHHEFLFGRSKPVFDQPVPSGNAVALRVLLALGDYEKGRRTAEAMLGWIQRAPQATEALLSSALPLVDAVALEEVVTEKVDLSQLQVTVKMPSRELQADSSGVAKGVVVISVPEGLHLNSATPPARWLVPTKVEIRPVKAEIQYPAAEDDRYEGEVQIPFTVKLDSKEAEFEVTVSFQACTDAECQEPSEKKFDCVAFR